MKYKAILFDLDGTLIDSVPTIMQCNRETMAAMGIHFDESAVRHAIGLPLVVQGRNFAGDRAEEFVVRYREVYLGHLNEDNHVFPGTLEMLLSLREKDRLMGVVTSRVSRGAHRAIEVTGMNGMFGTVITADDVERPKPEAEPLLKAIAQLGVSPEESIYVGDSAFDVDMAQRAGVGMIGVSWGARTREDLLLMCSDSVVDTWPQLIERLA